MKNKIIELEERLRVAMLHSNVSELDKLISPDLLFTNHLGILVSKEDDLRSHSNKKFIFNSLDLSESAIRIQENFAIISVKAEIQGEYNGQPTNGCFRFTRIWSKTPSDQWQIIAGHSSVIS